MEQGSIRLSLDVSDGIALVSKTEPSPGLLSRPFSQLKAGDDLQLRTVTARFTVAENIDTSGREPVRLSIPIDNAAKEAGPTAQSRTLRDLILDSRQGFWLLVLLAAGFGAAHALTPGHGKTLVAAYLVGERGKVGHAVVLGLVTTLTHTGAVLILAALLLFFFPRTVPGDIQFALGLVGGLLVAGMGLWLLLRRLSGGADHFHFGRHGHHHHHHDHTAYRDRSRRVSTDSAAVSWWGLTVLGISGGIVPCWDAILMLVFAISAQRLWLGLPLLLAFSAGLAAVLVALGIGVVYAKGLASSRWGESRLIRLLPVISAALVMGMGIWLCYESTHQTTVSGNVVSFPSQQ
jgi:ABC-type nickel/cobalt efflux system permease component RcnA